jgi:hypothetical protein
MNSYKDLKRDFIILKKYGVKEISINRLLARDILESVRETYDYIMSQEIPRVDEISHFYFYGVKVNIVENTLGYYLC